MVSGTSRLVSVSGDRNWRRKQELENGQCVINKRPTSNIDQSLISNINDSINHWTDQTQSANLTTKQPNNQRI